MAVTVSTSASWNSRHEYAYHSVVHASGSGVANQRRANDETATWLTMPTRFSVKPSRKRKTVSRVTRGRRRAAGPPGRHRRGHRRRREAMIRARVTRLTVFLFLLGFTLNLVGIVSHVAVSSFARRWFATPLPLAWTTEWYAYSWREFQLADVLTVTAIVAATVTALALLLGFPAAYVLARRDFPAKNAVLLLYFLPLLIPQMTYGIPLATALYRYRIGGTISRGILAHPVPLPSLALLALLPLIEHISQRLDCAARVRRAR